LHLRDSAYAALKEIRCAAERRGGCGEASGANMLDFRIFSGAVVVAVLIMAGILLSFDDRDVAIATLPRPHVETAIALRIEPVEPVASKAKAIVIPKPILTPAIATAAAPAPPSDDITGSINPAPAKETAPPPKPRARVTAKKPEPDEQLFNPLKLLFPFVDFTKSPFPVFVKQDPASAKQE
jgi:hypothetical protein